MYYILKNKIPIKCDSLTEWATQFCEPDNRIVQQHIATLKYDGKKMGEFRISTVFLGMDHNWFQQGDPILFQTMVFGGL